MGERNEKVVKVLIGIAFLVFTLFFLHLFQEESRKADCLMEIAENYCKEEGLSLGNPIYGNKLSIIGFTCKSKGRSFKEFRNSFLKLELEKCK